MAQSGPSAHSPCGCSAALNRAAAGKEKGERAIAAPATGSMRVHWRAVGQRRACEQVGVDPLQQLQWQRTPTAGRSPPLRLRGLTENSSNESFSINIRRIIKSKGDPERSNQYQPNRVIVYGVTGGCTEIGGKSRKCTLLRGNSCRVQNGVLKNWPEIGCMQGTGQDLFRVSTSSIRKKQIARYSIQSCEQLGRSGNIPRKLQASGGVLRMESCIFLRLDLRAS
jgi:hypothetical protein